MDGYIASILQQTVCGRQEVNLNIAAVFCGSVLFWSDGGVSNMGVSNIVI